MNLNDEVCACAEVTVGQVVDAIKTYNLNSVQDITSKTKAGAYCKGCTTKSRAPYKSIFLDEILQKVQKGKL